MDEIVDLRYRAMLAISEEHHVLVVGGIQVIIGSIRHRKYKRPLHHRTSANRNRTLRLRANYGKLEILALVLPSQHLMHTRHKSFGSRWNRFDLGFLIRFDDFGWLAGFPYQCVCVSWAADVSLDTGSRLVFFG